MTVEEIIATQKKKHDDAIAERKRQAEDWHAKTKEMCEELELYLQPFLDVLPDCCFNVSVNNEGWYSLFLMTKKGNYMKAYFKPYKYLTHQYRIHFSHSGRDIDAKCMEDVARLLAKECFPDNLPEIR